MEQGYLNILRRLSLYWISVPPREQPDSDRAAQHKQKCEWFSEHNLLLWLSSGFVYSCKQTFVGQDVARRFSVSETHSFH